MKSNKGKLKIGELEKENRENEQNMEKQKGK